MKLARRLDQIEPFYVMEFAKAAQELARQPVCDPAQGGTPMIYLNIGEPDFTAAPRVQQAAEAAIRAGRSQYTHANGLLGLRQALSGWYAQRWGLDIDPARIVITAGASAALQLLCLALFEPGDEVLMPDPSYPCNRHFVAAAGATPRSLPTGPQQRYQLDGPSVAAAWNGATRGVILASPSNPTGTSIAPEVLRDMVEVVRQRGGVTIVDEIYLGLCYDERYAHSALALGDDVISVNSFSKYFNMTGWRLGWLVLPPALVPAVEKLQQNLYICASTIAQHAALACFEPASLALYETRRAEFHRRRDFVLGQLHAMGLKVPVAPDGAFYVWIDTSALGDDSWQLCHTLMDRCHLALTPGRDFAQTSARQHLRLSFATDMAQLEEAMRRLSQFVAR